MIFLWKVWAFFDRQVSRTTWPIWARLCTLLEWIENKPYFKIWSLLLRCASCDGLTPSLHFQWQSLLVFTIATSPSTLRPLGPLSSCEFLWRLTLCMHVVSNSLRIPGVPLWRARSFLLCPTTHLTLTSAAPSFSVYLLPLQKTSVFCAGSSSQLILGVALLLISLTALRFWMYSGWQYLPCAIVIKGRRSLYSVLGENRGKQEGKMSRRCWRTLEVLALSLPIVLPA